ncbi:MAG: hypothetical protein ACXVP2_08920 [Tumebacillaceae bacterium]
MLDLMKLFEGYVRNYHTFQLTYTHGRHSATFAEIEYFARLGSMLGYWSFTEDSTGLGRKRMDLSWWDQYDGAFETWNRLVLHLEKENAFERDFVTIEKLFDPNRIEGRPENVIGIIAVANEARIEELLFEAKKRIKEENALLIFRIHQDDEIHAVHLEGKKVFVKKQAYISNMGGTRFMFFADENPMLATKTKRFTHDEEGYETWCKQNPSGFVFNFFSGNASQAEMNKIHRADCTYLWRPTDEGRRTVITKYCAKEYKELLAKVVSKREDSYSNCKHCCPNG